MRLGKPFGRGILLILALLALGMSEASGFEQPRNTISLGIQGQYGVLGGNADPIPDDPAKAAWASLVEFGEGLAVRIRYSTARNRAIGLSFEDQRFRRKDGLDDTHPKQIQLTQILFEYYLYFSRPKRTTQYMVLGAGFHRPAVRIETEDVTGRELEEVTYPGINLTLVAGVGLEHFVGRRTSVDLSLRGYGMNSDPTRSLSGEVALGIHYYTK
jgi:hypothetical protein